MGKLEQIGSYKYKCVCEICKKVFYEKKYRKDSSRYCSRTCAKSRLVKDLMGKKFGRLEVISFDGIKHRYAYWKCKCDCGNITSVRSSHLIEGTTTSCGCYNKEMSSIRTKELFTKHSLSNSRLYRVYKSIKSRCYCENSPEYKNYGGRGITICEEWRNDFKAFYDWAMANGYNENAKTMDCTIDRIDNNGNYEPSNCRFVDMKTQALNKRNNRRILYKGKSYTATEIALLKNCSLGAILWRLNNGWTVNDVFEIEVDNVHFNPRKTLQEREETK